MNCGGNSVTKILRSFSIGKDDDRFSLALRKRFLDKLRSLCHSSYESLIAVGQNRSESNQLLATTEHRETINDVRIPDVLHSHVLNPIFSASGFGTTTIGFAWTGTSTGNRLWTSDGSVGPP